MTTSTLVLAALLGAVQADPGVELKPDLAYGEAGGETLRLDLALPAGPGPHPAVLLVHGGGWAAGSRKEVSAAALEFAKRGYAAAAVDYRLAPRHVFPAQIEDVKRSVRWLRANAATHRIDPDRIGAWGGSAGAHLVALLGTTTPKDGLEGPGDERQSSRVRCVAGWAGPYDLAGHAALLQALPPAQAAAVGQLIVQFLGGTPDRKGAVYRKASATTYASKDDPPMLLVHGDRDDVVPFQQTEAFEKSLKAAGVPVQVLRLPGAGHGPEGQNLADALDATARFFETHLKPQGAKR
jgi:acetyl esterase/lipase